MFYITGCERGHRFDDKTWKFNDDVENPTLEPSYLTGFPDKEGRSLVVLRCHSFIKNGKIQFLSDCFHGLKNKTVALPNIPATWLR